MIYLVLTAVLAGSNLGVQDAAPAEETVYVKETVTVEKGGFARYERYIRFFEDTVTWVEFVLPSEDYLSDGTNWTWRMSIDGKVTVLNVPRVEPVSESELRRMFGLPPAESLVVAPSDGQELSLARLLLESIPRRGFKGFMMESSTRSPGFQWSLIREDDSIDVVKDSHFAAVVKAFRGGALRYLPVSSEGTQVVRVLLECEEGSSVTFTAKARCKSVEAPLLKVLQAEAIPTPGN